MKKPTRLGTLEIVVNALISLLNKKGIVKKDEIQLEILEQASEQDYDSEGGDENE